MNKVELINAVAEKCGTTKKEAEKMVEAFTEVVTETLKKGERVQLVGFGAFEAASRAARVGFNPQTKEKIEIAASVTPTFKAGKALKDALNGKE